MPIQGPVFSKQSDTVLSERPIQVSVPNLSVPYITARMAMYIWEASLADWAVSISEQKRWYGIIVTFPSYFRVSQVYSRIAGISMQLSEIISSLSIKKQEKLPTHCGQSTAVIFSGWISTSSTVCGSRRMPDWSVSKRSTVYGKTRWPIPAGHPLPVICPPTCFTTYIATQLKMNSLSHRQWVSTVSYSIMKAR